MTSLGIQIALSFMLVAWYCIVLLILCVNIQSGYSFCSTITPFSCLIVINLWWDLCLVPRLLWQINSYLHRITIWITKGRDELNNDKEICTFIQKIQQDRRASNTFMGKEYFLWCRYLLYLSNISKLKKKGTFGISLLIGRRVLTFLKNLPQGQ